MIAYKMVAQYLSSSWPRLQSELQNGCHKLFDQRVTLWPRNARIKFSGGWVGCLEAKWSSLQICKRHSSLSNTRSLQNVLYHHHPLEISIHFRFTFISPSSPLFYSHLSQGDVNEADMFVCISTHKGFMKPIDE